MSKERVEKAKVATTIHHDGAISHQIEFTDGRECLVLLKAGHPLMQEFAAAGSRQRLQGAINSAKDIDGAIVKVNDLDAAFTAGRMTINQARDEEEKGSLLARALAALSGRSVADMAQVVSGLTKAKQAAWRRDPRVAAKILELKEAPAADHHLEGLLGTLDGGDQLEDAA